MLALIYAAPTYEDGVRANCSQSAAPQPGANLYSSRPDFAAYVAVGRKLDPGVVTDFRVPHVGVANRMERLLAVEPEGSGITEVVGEFVVECDPTHADRQILKQMVSINYLY